LTPCGNQSLILGEPGLELEVVGEKIIGMRNYCAERRIYRYSLRKKKVMIDLSEVTMIDASAVLSIEELLQNRSFEKEH